MTNIKTSYNQYEVVNSFIQRYQTQSGSTSIKFAVQDQPNFGDYENGFTGSYQIIANIAEGRTDFASQSVQEILGISPQAVIQMPPQELITRYLHPEDIEPGIKMLGGFFKFAETISPQKLAQIRLIRTYRAKFLGDSFRKVQDQVSILECGPNSEVSKVFMVFSQSPLHPGDEPCCGLIVDTSNGEELMSFNPGSSVEHSLTKREVQILRLLALGMPKSEIAQKLSISEHTVDTHKKNIMKKLGVNKSVSLVWKAIELKLVEARN